MSEICLSYKPKIILTRKCYYNIKGNEMQVFSGIILKRKELFFLYRGGNVPFQS